MSTETTGIFYLPGEQERVVGISGFTVRPPQARRENRRDTCIAAVARYAGRRAEAIARWQENQS